MCRVTMKCMEVTARTVEEIPRGNLRVPRTEFVVLWRVTEYLTVANPSDWDVGCGDDMPVAGLCSSTVRTRWLGVGMGSGDAARRLGS